MKMIIDINLAPGQRVDLRKANKIRVDGYGEFNKGRVRVDGEDVEFEWFGDEACTFEETFPINWKQLSTQKQDLLLLIAERQLTGQETDSLEGIIQFIEQIQEIAVDQFEMEETIVYPQNTEKGNNENTL